MAKSNLSLGRRISLPPTWYTAWSATETLLLTCTLSGTENLSPTARTLEWLWSIAPDDFNVDMRVEIESVKDVADGRETIGYRWVAFDPIGIIIPANKNFRADLFIGRTSPDIPEFDFPFPRKPRTLAGIEAFMAIQLIPRLMHEALDGHTVILPRLEAVETGGDASPGPISITLSENQLQGESTWWGHNYYGDQMIIPTIRELS